MEHDHYSARLTELVAGGFGEAEARAGWEHVAGCRECQDVLGTMDRLRRASFERSAAGGGSHPLADEIVQFAIEPDQLATAQLGRIGAHLRACNHCRSEVDLTRRADREALSWWRRLGTAFQGFRIESAAPILAPALAALVIVLAYPAYQGAVRYPEARLEGERTAREVAGLRERERTLAAQIEAGRTPAGGWSGPVRLLYLPAATRGDAKTPTVAIAADQPYQTIVVDGPFLHDGAGTRRLTVTLERQDGSQAWRLEAAADELWDAASRAIVILVPASAFSSGTHAIVIAEADGAERFRGRFVVESRPRS